jgi:hypothetical protein
MTVGRTFFRPWLRIGCAASVMWCGAAWAQHRPGADFSGSWTRGPAVHADFKAPASGPGPILNLRPPPPDRPPNLGNTYAGDYSNPILQPWAAAIVKRIGDAALAGRPVPFPQNLCQPYGVPFILRLGDVVQFLPTPDLMVILYAEEMRARIVHMNGDHPRDLKPSYYGHSIGRWDADALVIDTIGLNDKTWTDRFGTPHTEQLHVVERYRRVDDATIRVDLSVEDPGAFTTPWSAYVVYSRTSAPYVEQVCPENAIDVLTGRESPIPRDDTPDF